MCVHNVARRNQPDQKRAFAEDGELPCLGAAHPDGGEHERVFGPHVCAVGRVQQLQPAPLAARLRQRAARLPHKLYRTCGIGLARFLRFLAQHIQGRRQLRRGSLEHRRQLAGRTIPIRLLQLDQAGTKIPGGWAAITPGTRKSTYTIPGYKKAAAAFAKPTLDAIQSAPIDNPGTTKRPGLPGVQYVGIPEFEDLGTKVSQEVSAAIAGSTTVDKALDDGQQQAAAVAKNYQGK